jgi:serine/threonine protein kinase
LDATKFFAAEIVLALEYLHNTANIIHRDLKPENILLSETNHVKMTDFGTAKRLKEGETRVRTASFLGTAEYISPECLAEEPEVCRASDLWALGCIIYQMLSGVPPFHGDTQFLTFEQVRAGKVTFTPHFPFHARTLIESLLSIDPESRIGATNYNDLKTHPFFDGIDFSTITETSPVPNVTSCPEYQLSDLSLDSWNQLLDDGEKVLEYGAIKMIGEQKKTKGFALLTSSHVRFLNTAQSRIRRSIAISSESKITSDGSDPCILKIKDLHEDHSFIDQTEFDPARWRRALRKAQKPLNSK